MVVDFIVATWLFERRWTPFDYAVPGQALFDLSSQDRFFYRTMLLVALPFLWCGVALTLRRLRSAGLPLYAVVLFFCADAHEPDCFSAAQHAAAAASTWWRR